MMSKTSKVLTNDQKQFAEAFRRYLSLSNQRKLLEGDHRVVADMAKTYHTIVKGRFPVSQYWPLLEEFSIHYQFQAPYNFNGFIQDKVDRRTRQQHDIPKYEKPTPADRLYGRVACQFLLKMIEGELTAEDRDKYMLDHIPKDHPNRGFHQKTVVNGGNRK